MAFDYSGLATTAANLVTKFGRDVVLVTITNSGDDWDPVQVETTETVKAIQTQLDNVDNDLILATDKGFLVSAALITVDMRIRDGSKDYSIVAVTEITPGDTFIIYKVQARK